MFYINTKFGFISELYEARDNEGKRTLKAKHCLDIREALPFETRSQAEAAYRKTYMASWWYCVLASHESKPDSRPTRCPQHNMSAIKVVVEVSGGVVASVYADAILDVVVVDYDDIENGGPTPGDLEFVDGVNVSDFLCGPASKQAY